MKTLEVDQLEQIEAGRACATAGSITAGLAIVGAGLAFGAMATPAGWLGAGLMAASGAVDIAGGAMGVAMLIAC